MKKMSVALTMAMIAFAFGYNTANAGSLTVEAGPIWNNNDAKNKCPNVCKGKNAKWTGHWWTTVWGKMSVCQCEGISITFKASKGDGKCPSGYVLATAGDARANQQKACKALGTWYIARLAGGGSMDGPGYKCKIRDKDRRGMGHSLCKKGNPPVSPPVKWVGASGGSVPSNALKGGMEHPPGKQTLYVCRAQFKGGTHPGKVRSAFRGCNIGWGGREHAVRNYQVLLNNPSFRWVRASNGAIPKGAVKGGMEHPPGKQTLYVCRAQFKGGTHPGKVRSAFRGCNIGWGGGEHAVRNYEVLVKK